MTTISRAQPYRLDFRAFGLLSPGDEQQLGTIVESADRMFETLFTDLAAVEASIPVADALLLTDIIALIAAAIAAIPVAPRYELLTNGYILDPELLFNLGDTISVLVP